MSDAAESTTLLEDVALVHRYRRRLLYCLFSYGTPMRLPDIAHQLTVWEAENDGVDTLQTRLAIYNALYHDHLPALREADLVDYHQQDDTVELGTAASDVEASVRRQLVDEIDTLLAREQSAIEASGSPG